MLIREKLDCNTGSIAVGSWLIKSLSLSLSRANSRVTAISPPSVEFNNGHSPFPAVVISSSSCFVFSHITELNIVAHKNRKEKQTGGRQQGASGRKALLSFTNRV